MHVHLDVDKCRMHRVVVTEIVPIINQIKSNYMKAKEVTLLDRIILNYNKLC